MHALPVRGPAVRQLGLPLPPARMPLLHRGRPVKRWRYVAVFSPSLTLCAGDARVGPLRRRWWAVAEPDGTLHGDGGPVELRRSRVVLETPRATIDLELDESDGVEVASPSGRAWIWTQKQANVPARGSVVLDGRELTLDGEAVVDDSAGYHERRTSWRWSAGVGRAESGERIGWNLVAGIHDSAEASERTVWVDREPREVGPVRFADDLSAVEGLRFTEWCAREERTNLLLFRNEYRQPFGTFAGELPGGITLAEGYGVMEKHQVWW